MTKRSHTTTPRMMRDGQFSGDSFGAEKPSEKFTWLSIGFLLALFWARAFKEKAMTTTTTYTYKSKPTAVALALLLGGFGAHRFYLGNAWVGVIYLVFALGLALTPFVFVVGLAALMDAIYIGLQDREYFKRIAGHTEVTA